MELNRTRRTSVITAAVLALSAIAAVLVNMPPLTECQLNEHMLDKHRWFPAMNAVVQPWLGPHHVYGEFAIPKQYWRDRLYTAKLMIQGFPIAFVETTPEGDHINGDGAEPGYYIKRVYLPTRVALRFLLTGRFGDLQASCHWWLIIADRNTKVSAEFK
jgi:hypothetical protein